MDLGEPTRKMRIYGGRGDAESLGNPGYAKVRIVIKE